jgi:hypothetical protein
VGHGIPVDRRERPRVQLTTAIGKGFGGAGVPPAILRCVMLSETAGGTQAPPDRREIQKERLICHEK